MVNSDSHLMQIYLLKDDKQIGPYTEEQLRGMVKAGTISASEFAWHEGIKEWQPLNRIISFLAGMPVPPQPPAHLGLRGPTAARKLAATSIISIAVAAVGLIAATVYLFVWKNGSKTQTITDSSGQTHIEAKPFKGEVYRSSDGRSTLTLTSNEECELRQDSDIILCKYTRENDALRVIVTAMGTTHVVYYRFINQGVQDNDGAILLSPLGHKAQQLVEEARSHINKKEWDQAIASCDEAIQLIPDDADAYFVRGFLKGAKSDNKGALADDDRAIALDPKIVRAYVNRSIVRESMGNYDGAIADATHAIELDPNNIDAYIYRGAAKWLRRDREGALADYNRAMAIDPNNSGVWNQFAWVEATSTDASLRNGSKAVEDATKACELTGFKDPSLTDTLACAYAEIGDWEHALSWEQKSLDATNDAVLRKEIQKHLDLFKQGKPYRE